MIRRKITLTLLKIQINPILLVQIANILISLTLTCLQAHCVYAWGETEEKEYYGKNDYIYYDASSKSYQDIGKDIAGTQYDVVHVKWGGIWKMPTEEQFYELIHHCSYQRSFINGIRGAIYTSSTNGAYIFLPSAEYRANYWSSTYSDRLSSGAKALYIFPSTFAASSYMDYEERSEGLHVRPVVKK